MSQRSFIGDGVASEVWILVQDQLAEALKLELHTLDPDGADLCPPAGLSAFRRLLETSPRARTEIRHERRQLIRRAGRTGGLVVRRSRTGRVRFAVPIFAGGEHVATVTGGGVLTEPYTVLQLDAMAERFGLDREALAAAADRVPMATTDEVAAAGRLIRTLLEQLILNLQLRERAEVAAERLERLAQVGGLVAGGLDILRVLDAVTEALLHVTGGRQAVVALIDDDDGSLRIRAGRGVDEQFMRLRLRRDTGLMGHVANTGEPLLIDDMIADPRNAYGDLDVEAGRRAMMCRPLIYRDRVLGVMAVFHPRIGRFNQEDLRVLGLFADYAASAVRNAQLYERMRQAYRELGGQTRRLQEAQEQLFHFDRLAEVGRLTGGAVHDLRNTLGGIIGVATAIRDHLDSMDREAMREMLAAIAEEGLNMRRTLEAVRQYAKPSHHGRGTHPLREMIDDAVRLLQFDPAFADLPIEVECADGLAVEVDRDRFKQVLVNLLRNGAEALEGLDDRVPLVRVAVRGDGNRAEVAVEDNGCGIAPAELARIWEPFYTTKGSAGTGLGLDNVKAIIEADGGSIDVVSTERVGTVFTIRLPLVEEGVEA